MSEKPPLPMIDGVRPTKSKYTFTGSITDPEDQPHRVPKLQDTVAFIMEGRVVAVNHPEQGTDKEIVRGHTIRVVSVKELSDEY